MNNAPIPKREPAVIAGLVLALLPAVIGFLTAFGIWEPTAAQVAAISGLFVALIALVIYVLRGEVWSPASVDALKKELEPKAPPEFP